MDLSWWNEMGWMHFPGVWLKQMSGAIRLCDCIGKLIALLRPLRSWSSCNFPASSPFSSSAPRRMMNTNYQLLANHLTRPLSSECTNHLRAIALVQFCHKMLTLCYLLEFVLRAYPSLCVCVCASLLYSYCRKCYKRAVQCRTWLYRSEMTCVL